MCQNPKNIQVADYEPFVDTISGIMVIGGESVPWWRSDHEYLNDIEMLEYGVNGSGLSLQRFPDSISEAAGAVMGGEYGYRLGCVNSHSLVLISRDVNTPQHRSFIL